MSDYRPIDFDGHFKKRILDRGAFYYEHGSVVDFLIEAGVIQVQVEGSMIYEVVM